MSLPDRVCSGQTREHLVPWAGEVWLHRQVVEPFARLGDAAREAGIDLAIASGFRSFDRQLAIWNAKASGQRPVLAADGSELVVADLSDEQRLFAILRWSALPGTSRHHWGTDMDIWDSAAVAADYRLRLVPGEYAASGPFARLGRWLDTPRLRDLGFARPYARDTGGVAPEPWHLSYLPLAGDFEQRIDRDLVAGLIAAADILLKDVILTHLEHILERFVVRCSHA